MFIFHGNFAVRLNTCSLHNECMKRSQSHRDWGLKTKSNFVVSEVFNAHTIFSNWHKVIRIWIHVDFLQLVPTWQEKQTLYDLQNRIFPVVYILLPLSLISLLWCSTFASIDKDFSMINYLENRDSFNEFPIVQVPHDKYFVSPRTKTKWIMEH